MPGLPNRWDCFLNHVGHTNYGLPLPIAATRSTSTETLGQCSLLVGTLPVGSFSSWTQIEEQTWASHWKAMSSGKLASRPGRKGDRLGLQHTGHEWEGTLAWN
jgi:hypothetical protein